jgi:hypothetical protein
MHTLPSPIGRHVLASLAYAHNHYPSGVPGRLDTPPEETRAFKALHELPGTQATVPSHNKSGIWRAIINRNARWCGRQHGSATARTRKLLSLDWPSYGPASRHLSQTYTMPSRDLTSHCHLSIMFKPTRHKCLNSNNMCCKVLSGISAQHFACRHRSIRHTHHAHGAGCCVIVNTSEPCTHIHSQIRVAKCCMDMPGVLLGG